MCSYDILTIKTFFSELLNCLEGGKSFDTLKMGELPYLRSLLWYSKQTYNVERLLCILPAVPGNADESINNQVLANTGIQSQLNTNQEVNLSQFIKSSQFKNETPEWLKSFFYQFAEQVDKSDRKTTVQDLIKFGMLDASKPSYGIETPRNADRIFATTDFVTGENSQLISPSKRLILASANDYLNMETLKGRLALLRKLQLISEVLIPRNWGSRLKDVQYISTERLYSVRNGLTHIEDNQNFSVIQKLESEAGENFRPNF